MNINKGIKSILFKIWIILFSAVESFCDILNGEGNVFFLYGTGAGLNLTPSRINGEPHLSQYT